MQAAIEEILLLQTEYTPHNTDAMQRRGALVRAELPAELHRLIPLMVDHVGFDDLKVEGRDGTGLKSEIPWTRIYSESRSPNATEGWYLVFLFSATGDRAYLSLIHGTTRWDGVDFKLQPPAEIHARVEWARTLIGPRNLEGGHWQNEIKLDSIRKLGASYEGGTVVAAEYSIDAIPTDKQIQEDLLQSIAWLGQLYRAGDEGLYVPGDSPEVADVVGEIDAIAEPRRGGGRGPRLTAVERRAIEQRAVTVTMGHFESLGYAVKDVGLRESYDLHATRDGGTLFIEVKGTTSNGSEIILTRNEVALHNDRFPANALSIVRDIQLDRGEGNPRATGGEMVLNMPWAIDDANLKPIAFSYSTGLDAAPRVLPTTDSGAATRFD